LIGLVATTALFHSFLHSLVFLVGVLTIFLAAIFVRHGNSLSNEFVKRLSQVCLNGANCKERKESAFFARANRRPEKPVRNSHCRQLFTFDTSTGMLSIFLALLSPACFLLAFIFPGDGTAILFFTVWLGSGLWAIGTLIAYGYSNKVKHQFKEAALSLLLGNLLVFFVFILKPT